MFTSLRSSALDLLFGDFMMSEKEEEFFGSSQFPIKINLYTALDILMFEIGEIVRPSYGITPEQLEKIESLIKKYDERSRVNEQVKCSVCHKELTVQKVEAKIVECLEDRILGVRFTLNGREYKIEFGERK